MQQKQKFAQLQDEDEQESGGHDSSEPFTRGFGEITHQI